MKILVALIGLALALNISARTTQNEIWNTKPQNFETGKIYQYKFQSQVLTGVPKTSTQYSGFRFETLVNFIFKTNTEVIMTLENIQLLKMNDKIPVDDSTILLDVHKHFEQLDQTELKTIILKELTRPIRFRYTQGEIRDIQVEAKDELWSVNLKKSILNNLHLNQETVNVVKPTNQKFVGDFQNDIVEEGIEGECPTTYNWNHLPIKTLYHDTEETTPLVITRTRDLHNCKSTPEFHHSMLMARDTLDEEQKLTNATRDLVQTEVNTKMNVTYFTNRRNVFVWNAKTTARYTFAPMSAKFGSISTFVKQQLTFLKVRQITNENIEIEEDLKKTTLTMKMPVPELHTEKRITETEQQELKTIINEIVDIIKNKNTVQIEKLPVVIKKFVQILRRLPTSEIERVHEMILKESEEVYELFVDILPRVGTEEAVTVLLEKVLLTNLHNKRFDFKMARRIRRLSQINQLVRPNIIKMLMEVTNNNAIIKNTNRKQTFKALLFTIGSLTKTHITYLTKMDQNTEEIEENVIEFFETLKEKELQIISNTEKLIVIVKAFGNTEIKRAIHLAIELVQNTKLDISVRINAIYTLNKFTLTHKETVQRFLLPYFFDIAENTEIRMAAFNVILNSQPSTKILYTIKQALMTEPTTQIKTYVLSEIRNKMTTKIQGQTEFKNNVTLVFDNLDIFENLPIFKSKTFTVPIGKQAKTFVKTQVQYTPKQFLPTGAAVSVMTESNNKKIDVLEVGARFEKLQKMLEQLLGSNGKVFTVEKLRELIKEHERDTVLTESNMALYVKIFGEEIAFFNMNEQVKEILEEGFIPVHKKVLKFLKGDTELNTYFQTTQYLDAIVNVPTVFGMPFSMNMTFVKHIATPIQAKFVKSVFDTEKTHLIVKTQPYMTDALIIEAGIDGHIVKAVTETLTTLFTPKTQNPIEINVVRPKIGEDKSIKIFVKKPETLLKVVTFRNRIYTTISELNVETGKFVHFRKNFKNLITLEKEDTLNKIHTLTHNFLGLTTQIKINRPQYFLTLFRPSMMWFGNFNVEITLKNHENVNDYVVLNAFRRIQTHVRKTVVEVYRTTTTPGQTIRNKGFFGTESKKVLGQLVFVTEKLDNRNIKLNLKVFKKTQDNEIVDVTTMIQLPRHITFNNNKPLTINEITEEHILKIKTLVTLTKNNMQVLEHEIRVSTDEKTLQLREKIVKNLEEFTALDETLLQCYNDLKVNFKSSVACYLTWKKLNTFNKFEHTLKIKTKVIKNFLVGRNALLKTLNLQHLRKIYLVKEFEDIDNTKEIKITRTFIVSPIDNRMGVVLNKVNDVIFRFQPVPVVFESLNQITPRVEILRNILKIASAGKYPATCRIHFNEDINKLQVLTFDQVFLNNDKVNTKTEQVKKVVIAQDINKHFQVSVIKTTDKTGIQLLVNDNEIQKVHILKTKNGRSQVLVNERVVELPYTIKTDEKIVKLQIKKLTQNDMDIEDLVQVYLPVLGVHIQTDGVNVMQLRVTPFFHSQLRGICGDFNGEHTHEIKDSQCKTFFVNPMEVFYAPEYVLTSTEEPIDFETAVNRPIFNEMLSLRTCRSNERLLPTTLTQNLRQINSNKQYRFPTFA